MPGPLRARTWRPRVRSLMTHGSSHRIVGGDPAHAHESAVASRGPPPGALQGVGLPVGGGGDAAARGRPGPRPDDLPLARPHEPRLGRGRHLPAGRAARRRDAGDRDRAGRGVARAGPRAGRRRAGPARLAAVRRPPGGGAHEAAAHPAAALRALRPPGPHRPHRVGRPAAGRPAEGGRDARRVRRGRRRRVPRGADREDPRDAGRGHRRHRREVPRGSPRSWASTRR